MPSLVNHGLQFTLKYLIMRGLLIDYLWFDKAVGISYLDDFFYHFNIINEPNIGIGYNEISIEVSGKSDVSSNTSESSKATIVYSDKSLCSVVKDIFLGFVPILLDPDVNSCMESSCLISDLNRCENVEVHNHEFISYHRKNRKSNIQ